MRHWTWNDLSVWVWGGVTSPHSQEEGRPILFEAAHNHQGGGRFIKSEGQNACTCRVLGRPAILKASHVPCQVCPCSLPPTIRHAQGQDMEDAWLKNPCQPQMPVVELVENASLSWFFSHTQELISIASCKEQLGPCSRWHDVWCPGRVVGSMQWWNIIYPVYKWNVCQNMSKQREWKAK